ncbi:Uncharacterized protein APZ42_008428, partial [Daphnia magna]
KRIFLDLLCDNSNVSYRVKKADTSARSVSKMLNCL